MLTEYALPFSQLNEKITHLEQSASATIQKNIVQPAREALGNVKEAVNEKTTVEGKRLILIGEWNGM